VSSENEPIFGAVGDEITRHCTDLGDGENDVVDDHKKRGVLPKR
jgi:hypothetical protein